MRIIAVPAGSYDPAKELCNAMAALKDDPTAMSVDEIWAIEPKGTGELRVAEIATKKEKACSQK